MPIRIGIIGDFDPNLRTHRATNAAFRHASEKLSLPIEVRWLATSGLLESIAQLTQCDALFAAAGTPYNSMQGALKAIEFARTREVTFLGTCGGFQHALIEFARNVLGLVDADSAEHGGTSNTLVIAPVSCAAPNRDPGGPKLSNYDKIFLKPDSLLGRIYGRTEISEEYFCNYEVNAAYRETFEAAGMVTAGAAADGQVRAIELTANSFFIGTLFQPQLAPLGDEPHPLIAAFIRQSASRAAIHAAG
jgi:CTP synthase (UTP-ammonia lyase)